jgi:DNA-binding XRE family transcriptional regulator
MPSLAATLRTEIRRVAAKEVRRALKSVRRAQRQVKALRLQARQQRRVLARLERRLARTGASRVPGVPGRPLTPDSIRGLRARLGMSRKQFSELLGVSPGSVFNWESGRIAPRGASRKRLAEVRRMGVRAARGRVKAAPRRRRSRRARR